jgi:hypothetical protein
MTQNLNNPTTKYQVKVNGRIVGEATSRTAADIIKSQLSESDKAVAVIETVASDGNQVLLG